MPGGREFCDADGAYFPSSEFCVVKGVRYHSPGRPCDGSNENQQRHPANPGTPKVEEGPDGFPVDKDGKIRTFDNVWIDRG